VRRRRRKKNRAKKGFCWGRQERMVMRLGVLWGCNGGDGEDGILLMMVLGGDW